MKWPEPKIFPAHHSPMCACPACYATASANMMLEACRKAWNEANPEDCGCGMGNSCLAKPEDTGIPREQPPALVPFNKIEIGEFLSSFATRACQIPADNWVNFICDTTENFCSTFGTEKHIPPPEDLV